MKKKTLGVIATLLIASTQMWGQSVWNARHLAEVRQSIEKPFYSAAYKKQKAEADGLLEAQPLSVMMKEKTPASGDKHDYMSQARYTWPDPAKPDGLPYITRDGITNPEIEKLDRNRLGATAHNVTVLSLAWYLSNDERYAKKATELIRVWFIDKETRMNPNLNYAQMIPGHNNGKGQYYGLIDTYSFVEMLDAVALLEQSKSFTAKDSKQLKAWFGKLATWMLTSEQGKKDAESKNNHGVAYDAQIIAFSLYSGNVKKAKEVIAAFPEKRIFTQIDPDGKQPEELRRTLAFHYSQYNLTHIIDVILMAKKLGTDLACATSADGRSFHKAMDFLASYTGKPLAEWPYKQISGMEQAQQNFCKDLYRTAAYVCGGSCPKEKQVCEKKAVMCKERAARYMNIYMGNRVLDFSDIFNLVYFQPTDVDDAYAFSAGQLAFAMECADKAKNEKENAMNRRVEPRSINPDGSLAMVHPHDWCSGFFPGSLWQMYDYTRDDFWRQSAISWTWPIEEAKSFKHTHDLGFMMYDSFGKAYELTGERSYKDVVLTSAKTLLERFNPTIGCIRSWDHSQDKWHFPVIIDNMMNLEMMFRATQLTGDSAYWKVAVTHANTTIKNHFRPDYSSYHLVDYYPTTGDVHLKQTCQGYSDDSFWSRGQSWGLYGYTMCYRFTHDPAYLNQAVGIAEFWLGLPNMPADAIPYWDMKAPEVVDCTADNYNKSVARDASAGAIVASALYELSTYVPADKALRYRAFADRIIDSLNESYRTAPGTDYGFLLLHSTGFHQANSEVDVPLCYADYYYLEALKRKQILDAK